MSLQSVPIAWQETMSVLAILINILGELAIVIAFGYAAWVQEGLGAALEERLSFADNPESDEHTNNRSMVPSNTRLDDKKMDSPVAIEMSEFSTSGVPVM